MKLAPQIRDAIVAHADFCHPQEACGLLAADATGAFCFAYCLTNVDGSPTRYTVNPVEHFRAMQHAGRNGWEIAGVFHSHPESDPYPSPTDVALATYPDWLYVVVGPGPCRELRAYRIRARSVDEEPLDG